MLLQAVIVPAHKHSKSPVLLYESETFSIIHNCRHSHLDDQSDDEDQDCCRICRSSAPPLFYPCKCSGSIKYVHQQCLMDWLGHSGNTHCEVWRMFCAPVHTAGDRLVCYRLWHSSCIAWLQSWYTHEMP